MAKLEFCILYDVKEKQIKCNNVLKITKLIYIFKLC